MPEGSTPVRIGKRALLAFVGILLGSGALSGAPKPKRIPPRELGPNEQYVAYRIELREDIMSSDVPFFIHRAVVAAEAAKADAVVLDLDTPGGRLDLMMEIRDELIALDMATYAFVNTRAISAGSLIAVAMDKIVMSPFSSIGGAQVITGMGEEIPEKVEKKVSSILKSEVRSTAKYKGHPVRICEAFIDASIEIPGLTPDDEVLTMDQEQAVTTTTYTDPRTSETVVIPPLAAFIAEDVEDLLAKEKIWPARILTYEMTWSEILAKRLMTIRALLLVIGLGALFLEAKTPGVGVPGAVGVIALALFFWGSYLADLSSFLEVVLFILGFFLLLLEIFVIPGFGLAGATGIVLIIASLIMAMIKLPPPDIPDIGFNTEMLKRALATLIAVFAGLVFLIWALSKTLPSTPLFRRFVLNPDALAEADRATQVSLGVTLKEHAIDHSGLVGKTGEALTDLRPAGMALVDGRRIDVVTQGDYIEQGAPIKVVDIHGNVHTVVEDREREEKRKGGVPWNSMTS